MEPEYRIQKSKTPISFDASTVQKLIEQAEQPGNAEWLKVLYFSRRPAKPGDLPVEKGWKLLTDELAKEKPASLKWFHLQNIRGGGAFSLPFVSPQEGLDAYSTIFDAAEKASPEMSEYVVRKGINEFVSLLTGRISKLNLEKQPDTREVIRKAMKAYFISFSYTNSFALRLPRPTWVNTFDEIGTDHYFKPFIENELKTTPHPSYEFCLVSAAALLQSGDQQSRQFAIPLLLKAKPLIPKLDNGKIDPAEGNQYYRLLGDLYRSLSMDKEATEIAREQADTFKQGRAVLVEQLLRTQDYKSVSSLVADLSQPQAHEAEILAVSEQLYRFSVNVDADVNAGQKRIYNEELANQLKSLLNSYLTATRTRTAESELVARLRLSRTFVAGKEYTEALKTIEDAKLLLTTNLTSSEVAISLRRLKQRISDEQKPWLIPNRD